MKLHGEIIARHSIWMELTLTLVMKVRENKSALLTIPAHESAINFSFNADVSEVVCEMQENDCEKQKKWRNNGLPVNTLTHFNLILLAQSNSFAKMLSYPPSQRANRRSERFPCSHHVMYEPSHLIINYSTNKNEKWNCIKTANRIPSGAFSSFYHFCILWTEETSMLLLCVVLHNSFLWL